MAWFNIFLKCLQQLVAAHFRLVHYGISRKYLSEALAHCLLCWFSWVLAIQSLINY